MRVNWFSPVPPAQSAIADVTERLVPSIAERMEVTVWTDVPDFDRSRFPDTVRVNSCSDIERLWPEINFADFSIYHIGNDVRFHGQYAWMLERHPGIVVLHDFNLHELHRERFIHKTDGRAAFHRYVLRTGGRKALQAVLAFQSGRISFEEAIERAPLIESVTRYATGIISFNEGMETALRARTRAPLLLCPLPLGPAGSLPAETPRQAAPGERVELVMFGFLNSPNRRLMEVLQALTAFPAGQVRLTLFGHIEDREPFDRRIRERRLTDRVRYLGYLNEDQMAETLKSAHLAINLRNPTRGESSDALLKAWKYALPVLVTKTGYYATLPQNIVCPVEPGDEVEGVRRHIDACRKSPESYFTIGSAAWRHLMEHHTAEAFAESLGEFLELTGSYKQRAFAWSFARRMGDRIREDCPGSLAADILRTRIASELEQWAH